MRKTERVIYADLLFFINLFVDFLSLLLAGKILHKKTRFFRLLLSSVFGALYAVPVAVLCPTGLLYILLHVVFSLLICLFCYDFSSFADFFGMILVFYAVCVILGGTMTAISTLGLPFSLSLSSPKTFILFACLIFFSAFFAIRAIRRGLLEKTVKVKLVFGKREDEFLMLVDSGNIIRDPFCLLPVIVIKHENMEKFKAGNMSFEKNFKFRYIPVKTVSGSKLLSAYKPTQAYLYKNGRYTPLHATVAESEAGEMFANTDGLFPSSLL